MNTNIVQQVGEKLVECGYAARDVESVISNAQWRYLQGKTILRALLDGEEDKVFQAIAAFGDGAYI